MPRRAGIGRAELEILRYITDHHPVSVRDVADHLAATKGHTRTTALNVMERLREKGYLTREKAEGVYRYSPSQSKGQLLRSLVRDFVDGMLGGSLEPFVAYLTHDAHLNDDQVEELRQLVRQLDEERQEGEP
jgi:predicted transcriptional regulator